jgi:tetratricopeptide (TPR) repeat protein
MLGGALLRNRPVRAYVKGYRAIKIGTQLSESQQPDRARAYFEKAIRVMSPIVAQRLSYDHQDVIHCILFSAMSYERLGEAERAEVLYRLILAEYPYSRYVGEAYVKIARLRKQGRDQAVEDGLTRLSQGDIAVGLSLIRKGLNQTQESLRYFNAAIEKDPYSVWADYALDDIKKERDYLRKKQPLIVSSCDQQDVQNFIEAVLAEAKESIQLIQTH